MVDVNKLRGVIAERGKSQADVARMLGINDRTFYKKMKRKVFDSDEILRMCNYLRVDETNMISIFFKQNVM